MLSSMMNAVVDDELPFGEAISLGAKGEAFAAAALLSTDVENCFGVEPFEKGFLAACFGMGGNGAAEDFCAEFFSDETEFTVPPFLEAEKGFVGALVDKGGKAAALPELLFDCFSFNWTPPFGLESNFVSFFFMSIVALNFSGVVPKLARVSREASDSVVCFKSLGTCNDNWSIRLLSIDDGLSQPLLALTLEGGEKIEI